MQVKAPSQPLPATYRPTGSVPYRVGDRDNWVSLAASQGVSPAWLIQYNFETHDLAEINWYLKTRVGCTKTTHDGKNFMFSASAKPGIIYLPTPQTVRALSNMKYGKFGLVIEGDDDYQKQVDTTLAWIARSCTVRRRQCTHDS
jgi:hypothetical protein